MILDRSYRPVLAIVVVLGLAVLTAVLAACTSKDAETAPNTAISSGVSNAEFEAYLKLKGIPPKAGDRRDRALTTFRERNAIAEAILREPALDRKMVEAEIRDFRNELLIRRHFEAFLREAVTEQAAKDYYDKNIEKYARRGLKLAYIPFRTDVSMRASEKSVKLARASETHALLQAGTPFSTLAYWYSEDAESGKRGGELGWVEEGKIDQAVFERALSMKKGEVSEPINTATGYYIVQLLDDPIVEYTPFEEVKNNIAYRLRQEAKQAEMKRLLEKGQAKTRR